MTHPIAELHTSLLEAQKNIGAAVKGSENPFYKSNYADLGAVMAVVKKPLNDAGICITQDIAVHTQGDTLVNILQTTLRHINGEMITSSIVIPEQKDIQKLGAAISYCKRYLLQALLLVPTIDDDGNSLVKPPKKTAKLSTARPAVKF